MRDLPVTSVYIRVTSDLVRRVAEHREGTGSAFTRQYGVTKLVWFQDFAHTEEADQRETSLKRWRRAWKIALIERPDPDWRDLFPGLRKHSVKIS